MSPVVPGRYDRTFGVVLLIQSRCVRSLRCEKLTIHFEVELEGTASTESVFLMKTNSASSKSVSETDFAPRSASYSWSFSSARSHAETWLDSSYRLPASPAKGKSNQVSGVLLFWWLPVTWIGPGRDAGATKQVVFHSFGGHQGHGQAPDEMQELPWSSFYEVLVAGRWVSSRLYSYILTSRFVIYYRW